MGCKVKCHNDGTITFYSIYSHTWYERARSITNKEYEALDIIERARLEKHFNKYPWYMSICGWYLDS